MFANLGFTEILILLLVLLLVFGARRIPEIGASIGQGIKEFKRSLKDTPDEPAGTVPPAPPPASSASLPPSGGEPKRLNQ
jgi:sec-independent protein translocase protein TatA